MYTLRIEHEVPNFDGWKKAFDSDPINRQKAGVQQYRIYRTIDNPNFVIIDMEFESKQNLDATMVELQKLWKKVEGTVMISPHIRILELYETRKL